MTTGKIEKRNLGADANTLALYLREINKIPLLTREEEQSVARAAVEGDEEARQRLLRANLRFVVNVAKGYQGRGLPLADLISEGNVGLMNALERFDVDKGYRFISYAVWWIRQAICRALGEKVRLIRLPMNRASELVQIEKARKLLARGEGEDEIGEVARLLSMDPGEVSKLLNLSRDVVSLENPVYDEWDSQAISDYIVDDHSKSPEDAAADALLQRDIEGVLKTLHPKEAAIIRYRYGLVDGEPLSLKEIGKRLNLTKERIRQIEKKALHRLRHPIRLARLKSYVA